MYYHQISKIIFKIVKYNKNNINQDQVVVNNAILGNLLTKLI